MASFDRQFEPIWPTRDRLHIQNLEVADSRLLDPNNGAVVPLIDGELVQEDANYKFVRATDADRPSYFVVEWRGDYGVQASRKLAAIKGGTFEADTIVFDTGLTTLGTPVKLGTVNNSDVGSVNRAGLIAQGGTNLIVGYVTRVASTNNGRLRFIQTAV